MAAIARATGDLELAEDAVQEAFAAALERWPRDGAPRRPGAWIVTVARNRALDVLRRRRVHARALEQRARLESLVHSDEPDDTETFPDDRLALVFTCCHPALAVEAQVALTLRLVGGLETGEIARAFLVPEATMAQRLVRAKRKVRDARIPVRTPGPDELHERLTAVLAVVYLVFNQGYSTIDRNDLAEDAIRLSGMLVQLLPDEPEVLGLAALVLLQHSRHATRVDDRGVAVMLDEQDRTRWDRDAIQRGIDLLRRAARLSRSGPYQLQAAIAACHATASDAERTDWRSIVALYTMLHQEHPSPIVALNRAAAVSFADGPAAALPLVEELSGELGGYHLLHAARGDILRRLGRVDEALVAYRLAHELAASDSDRRFLDQRVAELLGDPR